MKKYRCLDCGKILVTVDDLVGARAISEFDDKGMEINISFICDECYNDRIKREEWETG